MTEQRPLISPPINFATAWNGNAYVYANKILMPLDSFLWPGYEPLGDAERIVRAWGWYQGGAVPAGVCGDIALAVTSKRYVSMSGVPYQELCPPFGLKTLAAYEFLPGARHQERVDHLPAIVYRKAEHILMFTPEVMTPYPMSFQVFFGLGFEGEGEWPMLPGVYYTGPMLGAVNGVAGTYCIRTVIPAAPGVSGGHVQVDLSALAGGCTVLNASIGVQNGFGHDMAAAPAPVLFGGNVGVNIPAFGIVSGFAPLVTTGAPLLLNLKVTGAWSYRDVADLCSWVSSDHDSYAEAAMGGTISLVPQRAYAVSLVRALP